MDKGHAQAVADGQQLSVDERTSVISTIPISG
jgi:hypothetical protein